MMLALGGLIALLAVPTGSVLAIIIPLADLLILLLGIMLLLDRNPFKTLPQIQVPVLRHPLPDARPVPPRAPASRIRYSIVMTPHVNF